MNKTTLIGLAALVGLLAVVGIASMFFPFAAAPQGPVLVTPSEGPISVTGSVVCLPHKDTSGPQTMECAFGLKDTEGIYFALRDSDPEYKNISGIPMNTLVEVSGMFTMKTDSKYQDIGIIEVFSVRPVGTPSQGVWTGVILCLPHVGDGPHTEECAFGLKTDDGAYYALDGNLIGATDFETGKRVIVSGTFTPVEALSSSWWQSYPIEGIISVASIGDGARSDGKSGITGTVFVGPTCPVMREPPDPQCADKPYRGALAVMTSDGNTTVASFAASQTGAFSVIVPPGRYIISMPPGAPILPRCSIEEVIVVVAGTFANVSVSCDSGIR